MQQHQVAVLALDGVIAFELATPSRLFESTGPIGEQPLYRVRTCSVDGGPVRTSADFRIVVEHGPELLAEADTVVVPAPGPELTQGRLPDEVRAALARIRPGARLLSICTGAFVLAAAGLLDGRTATTHWHHTQRFRELFPQVRLDPDVLFVDDGDVLSSGGVAAGVDLCMHVIRRDHGSAVANYVARRCVVPPWRDGGQAQYVDLPVPEREGATTAPAREWALDSLDASPSLRELAARCGMSVRTFTRRFREETGLSPGQWLTRQRTAHARRLLEGTDLTVDHIARVCGFGTAASMRAHFQAEVGVAPSAYRRTFSGTR